MKPIFYETASRLSAMLENKEISSVELTKAVIERTKAIEPKIGAFLSYDEKRSLENAQKSDKRRAKGELLSALDGIPVSFKDLICEKGQPLTCASKILANYVSPYDATVTEKLKAAGAVPWGRLNMDEFAMGSSTEHSAFKETANPWNLDRTPGGSSGGSAACIAAGQAILSLGSDTGGSIRQPAAYCGIVGLKPTYGLVSRYGLSAFASSLDQIGPFGRTVEDVAMLLEHLAGHDPRDSTSFNTPIPNYKEALKAPKKEPWKIGLPKEYFAEGLTDTVRKAIEKAIDFYKEAGATLVEISLPHMHLAVPTYYIIAPAEASSNLARFDGIRYTHRSDKATNAIDIFSTSRNEGFGEEVKRRILLGTFVLSSGYYDAYYNKAQKVRTLLRKDFMDAFERVDVILTPTTPDTAFRKGSKSEDPMAMYLEDIYTLSVNLAGLPGLSVPCGFSEDGLPIGMQLIGKPFEEKDLLSVAYQFDKAHLLGTKLPTNL